MCVMYVEGKADGVTRLDGGRIERRREGVREDGDISEVRMCYSQLHGPLLLSQHLTAL